MVRTYFWFRIDVDVLNGKAEVSNDKKPWLFSVRGLQWIILPSDIGIIMHQYKDPY